MFLIDLIITIFVGGFLTLLFAMLFKRTGPWDNIFFFFLIIVLGTWAGGVWFRPIESSFIGYPWISFLIVGILIAMIIASAGPPRTLRKINKSELITTEEIDRQNGKNEVKRTDLFFVALILLFLITIILGYFLN